MKFFIVLLVFLLFTIPLVSASDMNETIGVLDDFNQTADLNGDVEVNSSQSEVEKTTPVISIKSGNVKSKDTINIYLKNSTGSPLKSKNLTATLNNKKYSLSTDSNGLASLKISLPSNKYKLTVSFNGDDQFKSVSKKFNVKVSKIDTKITPWANFLIKGKYFYVDLSDSKGNPIASKKIRLRINSVTYTQTTDNNGRAGIKIKLNPSNYRFNIKFDGNSYYKSCEKNLNFRVMHYTYINIANTKLLSNGFLRIYLKDSSPSEISHKNLIIKVANKKFNQKTNSEGIVVIKPNLANEIYKVTVKYGKYWTSKKIKGVIGNVKDPLKEKVPLKNRVPNIDLMPKNYVMGDGSATYTLTKAQYKEVLKRDSYCLFLNNKLSKYTFFKTKSHPNTNHIIKREKWNVIERELNAKLVKANKYNYWPSKITVSLKGKSYTYSEVRDPQNTEYTCGPTSASVCSQVLKNYLSEKYLAKKAGTKPVIGTPCHGMIKALGKNFNCTYFYKNSFNYALKELKKGGCALIFHTRNHYVTILDISKDGKKVLVSNSYKSFNNIPSKWLTVSYMKTRFVPVNDDGMVVRLNYSLSNSTKESINSFYKSMGANWVRQNTHATFGFI